MLLPTLRNAPVANSANAESISVSVISATRCERRFRTFFFLKKVNIRKRFRNPAHRSKFKLYRPLGYIIIPKILTHIQQSNQIRMHSAAEKSSLTDISAESGCILPPGIIPGEQFCRIRMHFCCWNSSLASNSAESGCISPLEFIPPRLFLLIRMNSAAGNHPWRAILPNQDAFLRRNSSLQDISC